MSRMSNAIELSHISIPIPKTRYPEEEIIFHSQWDHDDSTVDSECTFDDRISIPPEKPDFLNWTLNQKRIPENQFKLNLQALSEKLPRQQNRYATVSLSCNSHPDGKILSTGGTRRSDGRTYFEVGIVCHSAMDQKIAQDRFESVCDLCEKDDPDHDYVVDQDKVFNQLNDTTSNSRSGKTFGSEKNHEHSIYINETAEKDPSTYMESTWDSFSIESKQSECIMENAPQKSTVMDTPFFLETQNNRKMVMLLGAFLITLVVIGVTTSLIKSLFQNSDNTVPLTSSQSPNDGQSFISPISLTAYGELEFRQIGITVSGNTDRDGVGQSVSLATNGNTVAVGAPGSVDSLSGESFVTVFDIRNITMKFVTNISGSVPYDGTGYSVAVNGNGNFVAVGSPFIDPPSSFRGSFERGPGSVSVYSINSTEGQHYRVGSVISGLDPGDEFGWHVALSASGRIVAIASRTKCSIQVFQVSTIEADWSEYGNPLNCTGNYENYSTKNEFTFSMSRDGSTIVLGEHQIGRVSVYKFQNSSLSWIQLGASIESSSVMEEFGASVAVSFNGNRVISCSPGYRILQRIRGKCSSYKYNKTSDEWIKFVPDIFGKVDDVRFGSSVSLSDPGTEIAIGAVDSKFPDGGERDSGYTNIYELNRWEEVWRSVGFSPIAKSGFAVSVTVTGPKIITVAIGNPLATSSSKLPIVGTKLYQNFWTERYGVPVEVNFGWSFESESFNWTLERLDGDVNEPLRLFGNESKSNSTEGFLVSAEGVYRVTTDAGFISSLKVNNRNIEISSHNPKQVSFLGRLDNFESDAAISLIASYVTLEIEFDDHPEEIHWVLVAEENTDNHRMIVDYGPKSSTYTSRWIGSKLVHVIDVSAVSKDAVLTFIVTDDGHDGFNGSITLFDGCDSQKSLSNGKYSPQVLLNVTNSGWMNRYSNWFLLHQTECDLCVGPGTLV